MKNIKKGLIMMLVLAMVLLAACSSNTGTAGEEGLYKDGTYTGTGKGFGGDIEVEVIVEGGNISEMNVTAHEETDGISDPAFEGIKEQLLEKQSVDEIDSVSGATSTSEGLIEAITDALSDAGK